MPSCPVPGLFRVPWNCSTEQPEQRNINVPGVPLSIPLRSEKLCKQMYLSNWTDTIRTPLNKEVPGSMPGAFHLCQLAGGGEFFSVSVAVQQRHLESSPQHPQPEQPLPFRHSPNQGHYHRFQIQRSRFPGLGLSGFLPARKSCWQSRFA